MKDLVLSKHFKKIRPSLTRGVTCNAFVVTEDSQRLRSMWEGKNLGFERE